MTKANARLLLVVGIFIFCITLLNYWLEKKDNASAPITFEEVEITPSGSLSCSSLSISADEPVSRICQDFVAPSRLAIGDELSAEGQRYKIKRIKAGLGLPVYNWLDVLTFRKPDKAHLVGCEIELHDNGVPAENASPSDSRKRVISLVVDGCFPKKMDAVNAQRMKKVQLSTQ